MANLKELKGRINSVKSTQKITKAKKMVAAAKLRKAQAAAEAARPYAERLEGVVASLASKVGASDSAPKLLSGTGKSDTHLLVVLNSDRGLAGAFNSNIVKAARDKALELQAQGKKVLFYLVGRKGRPVINRLFPGQVIENYETTGIRDIGFEQAHEISAKVMELFEAGAFDVAPLLFEVPLGAAPDRDRPAADPRSRPGRSPDVERRGGRVRTRRRGDSRRPLAAQRHDPDLQGPP